MLFQFGVCLTQASYCVMYICLNEEVNWSHRR